MINKKNQYFEYKGKPLLRKDDKLQYGKIEDNYIAIIEILDKEKINTTDVASKVSIKLQTNTGNEKERLIKKAERDGLYKAIDLAEYWLNEALEMDSQNN